MKWMMVAALLIFVLAPVLAASPHLQPRESSSAMVLVPQFEAYKQGANPQFYVQVFNGTGSPMNGSQASCTLVVFEQNGSKIQETALTPTTYFYTTTLSSNVTAKAGYYSYTVWCAVAGDADAFYGDYFDVTATGLPWATNEDLTPIAVIILLPFLLALVTLIGSVTLDAEEHPALKIGLFLFSYLPFYVSLWWGAEAVGRFYNFPTLTEAIASGTFFGIIFFILLVFYVVIYFMVKAYQAIAEKNAKRLSY